MFNIKKICLITPNLLPVPNVLGGAIETLVTNILKEQTIENKIDITIVSIYNKLAYQESKKYKNTKFIFIKKNLKYLIYSTIYHIINKIFKKNLNTYNHIVLNKIKNEKFDYIIAEGGHYESYQEYLKYFKKDQLVLHLHHTATSNEVIDSTFSKVIGVSDYVLKKFKDTSSIKKYYLLKNCIDIEKYDKKISTKELNEIRKIYNINKDDFVLMYCGRLIKEKGVLELIKSVNNLKEKNIKLLVIGSINFASGGEDEYTKEIKKIAKNNKNIIFTGYIDGSELYKYYKLSNAVVIPSVWEEAAGLVCIEAMICKKPIITTGRGGIKEYVNKDAILVNYHEHYLVKELTDAILKLYNNKEKLQDIGQKSYEEALQYSTKNYYKNLVNIIEVKFNE